MMLVVLAGGGPGPTVVDDAGPGIPACAGWPYLRQAFMKFFPSTGGFT